MGEGWNQSASIGATGQSFEIRTVADFMKVPIERRYVCLREFYVWLALPDTVSEMVRATAKSLGLPEPVMVPNLDVFVWHDDGEGKASVSIVSGAEK